MCSLNYEGDYPYDYDTDMYTEYDVSEKPASGLQIQFISYAYFSKKNDQVIHSSAWVVPQGEENPDPEKWEARPVVPGAEYIVYEDEQEEYQEQYEDTVTFTKQTIKNFWLLQITINPWTNSAQATATNDINSLTSLLDMQMPYLVLLGKTQSLPDTYEAPEFDITSVKAALMAHYMQKKAHEDYLGGLV